jgi:circadian clock protein KaiC
MILLRSVEVRRQIRRLIAILKVRDSDYDPTVAELMITDQGIRVEDSFRDTISVLAGTSLRAVTFEPIVTRKVRLPASVGSGKKTSKRPDRKPPR